MLPFEYTFDVNDTTGWKSCLRRHVFVVLTDVLSDEDIDFGNQLFTQQYPDALPSVDDNGFIEDPTFTFSEYAWYTRSHPSVLTAYHRIYDSRAGDLVVCFDRGNAKEHANGFTGEYWLHVDYPLYDTRKIEGIFYQSFVSYTTSYGLRAVSGSNLRLDQTRSMTEPSDDDRDTFFFVNSRHHELLSVTNVLSPAGSLTIWDSRTIHDGDESIDTPRRCVYLCYAPAQWMTRAEKTLRKKIFKRGQTTTHWPVRYINYHYDDVYDWNYEEMIQKYPQIKSLVPL